MKIGNFDKIKKTQQKIVQNFPNLQKSCWCNNTGLNLGSALPLALVDSHISITSSLQPAQIVKFLYRTKMQN